MTTRTKTRALVGRAATAAALALTVAACASPFRADVSRFQSQLPAPAGQTFAVVADDPALAGGIEFGQYAEIVTREMAEEGFVPAASPESADLLVRFDYGVDNGRERVRSTGRSAFGYGYPGYFHPWYGYRRIGFYRGGPWAYGFYDPFFDDYGSVRSYTVYTSGIDMKIDRAADGQRLFEGKAEAVSRSNDLPYLVPNLVEAMFTGFPGNSGETVRISVAPEDRKGG